MDLGGLSDSIGSFTINGGTITNGTLAATSYNLLAGGFYATVSGNGTLTRVVPERSRLEETAAHSMELLS